MNKILKGKTSYFWDKNHPTQGTYSVIMFLVFAICSQTEFIKCEPKILPTPQIPFPSTCTSQAQ